VGRRGRVLTRARAPQDGATPLSVAAQNGHLPVVRALVDAGADKNAKDKVGERREVDVGRTNCQRHEG
jgi:hypothetical protein